MTNRSSLAIVFKLNEDDQPVLPSSILDIPVYKSRIQSLHLLFSLYSEFKNSEHFKALTEGKKAFTPSSNSTSQAGDMET
ncbi:Intraflagellar transport protein 46 [Saguinus oedipus]|uniref:Intraflagellar transport protein 46 homolog n=1 Tax=Saguinus oedipus TaxID=9490 RepID=A0ABQ9UR53_SAGOE|nr:Intraflagellar transport protein 46 [Saguinus oedipus]